jgi:hypothetical protein
MSDLARRQSSTLGSVSWNNSREVMAARGEGVIRATRIEAAAYVTHIALQAAGRLSNMEAQLIKQAPLGEARYQAIVDAFTNFAVGEVTWMGLR